MDLSALLSFCVGEMGMSVNEFYDCTFEEINAIVKGYVSKREFYTRQHWEAARMIAYNTVLPHTKKRLKPTDIIEFSWEKEEKTESLKELIKKKSDLDKMFPKTLPDAILQEHK